MHPALQSFSRLFVAAMNHCSATLCLLAVFGAVVALPAANAAEQSPPGIKFERDVVPVLASAGCSTGPCHGKQRGQNGFQLSLLGFDPDFDYAAITQEARGRRVFPAAPDKSLLLLKATGQVSHGGGTRFPVGSPHYELLKRWIAKGMPRQAPGDPTLARIVVDPAEVTLGNRQKQTLRVTAVYSDHSSRDVTGMTAFASNESAIAAVDKAGQITTGPLPGEAAIMARYLDKIAVVSVLIPQAKNIPAEVYAQLPRHNFIDDLVWQKLERLGVTPSSPASDATLLRRTYLDIIGRLPTGDEVRAFLADTSSEKRVRLVDQRLDRPEYADYWANKWADLLRPNPYRVGLKTVLSFDAWIRDAFRQNKPYDQFVRELVAAQGSTWRNGATVLFRDRREGEELTTLVSQLFLGIRLECAKCHHHPFEVWGQDDFYSFAAYFSRIGRKGTGLSPPISGSEEMVFTGPGRAIKHPLTSAEMKPRPLFGEAPPIGEEDDPREALAQWITSPDNPYFVQVIANRIWADLMGRGLVEPVDDLRATNPPSNGPLLLALGDELRREGYDLKRLIRTICTSYVYGLSSQPNESNLADTRNYSRHYRRRLRGEVLLDALTDITEVPETFSVMPPRSRATELWTHRSTSLFLDAFGRPDPNQDPPCERTDDTTVVQTLHLMNSPNLHRKITADESRMRQLAQSDRTAPEILEELYLRIYSRLPSDEELPIGVRILEKAANRRQAIEDLAWAMINTPEFVFED